MASQGAEGGVPAKHNLRSLLTPLLLPSLLFAASRELVTPVLPIYALRTLGASEGQVGLLVAAAGAGKLLGALPGGSLVQRYKAKPIVLGALAVDGLANFGILAVPSLGSMMLWRLVAGGGLAGFMVARQSYVAQHAEPEGRGLIMSAVGGTRRMAGILAPALGAVLAERIGVRAAFGAQILCTLAAGLLVWTLLGKHGRLGEGRKDAPAQATGEGSEAVTGAGTARTEVTYGRVLREHGGIFVRVGLFTLPLFVAREARHVLVPLYGDALGLSQATIGIISSIGYFVDAAAFPLSGYIMDKRGRKASGVPSCLGLAAGILCLPLASGPWTLMALAGAIGLGNGLSGGLVMTMGADLAPQAYRPKFLAVYRLLGDLGVMLGPLSTGCLAQALGLAWACRFVAAVGAFAAIWMATMVPETKRATDRPAKPMEKEMQPVGLADDARTGILDRVADSLGRPCREAAYERVAQDEGCEA